MGLTLQCTGNQCREQRMQERVCSQQTQNYLVRARGASKQGPGKHNWLLRCDGTRAQETCWLQPEIKCHQRDKMLIIFFAVFRLVWFLRGQKATSYRSSDGDA